ncbi:geranylgeranylglycerol-phosphate geranylgeranyltransferase [bacterium SCSIO 12741]|nr:geranylgeranylglycerol-phosphate geranylgeranyltransferase [bacterium SCSIO 12741]
MNPVVAYIKAVRWQNLAIMALIMYLLRWAVFKPYLALQSLELQFSELDFFLLVLSVILVAGAGNIINDYFDIKIDRVNKPDRIIVGRHIKRRVAMASHIVMNGIAVALAGYVAIKAGSYQLALIHVILIATLWFYSTDFKRRLVWGNLAIALCVAIVPLMVSIYEVPALVDEYHPFLEEHPQAYGPFMHTIKTLFFWTLAFSGFAFLMTFAREITKDIVDMKGDSAFGCKTMPVVFGIRKTSWILITIYLIVLGLVVFLHVNYVYDRLSALYFYGFLGPLILFIMWLTYSGKESKQFRFPAEMNKIASVVGILYMLIVYYHLSA